MKFIHFRRQKELVGTVAYATVEGKVYFGALAVSDTEISPSYAEGRRRALGRLQQAMKGKEADWGQYVKDGHVVDVARGMDYIYRHFNVKKLGQENPFSFGTKMKAIRDFIEEANAIL